MRVLFWTELFWPEIGGLELFGMQLISALRRRGHEFAVVAALHRADAEPELSYEGVPVFRFPFQHALIRRDLRAVHTLVEQSAEIKRRWKPDVIHLNSIGSSMFFYERAQARMAAPAVFTLHSPFLAEGDPDSLLGRVLATAQWVTGVSRSTLDRALRVAPAIAPRASVVLNGLEMPSVQPSDISLRPPRLLCIGRMVEDKGFDVAVAAFAQVVKEFPEARLMLAGDGLVRPALEAQAAALGIAASVDFKGWVPPEQVPALIDRSSIVLMPSRYEEPFGLVAVQAGQMARPLVASRAGGIPEIVKDGETGLLVPPEDVSALAEAILELLCDPEQAARLGRAARKHVEAAFELERVATAYETLYRHVCSN